MRPMGGYDGGRCMVSKAKAAATVRVRDWANILPKPLATSATNKRKKQMSRSKNKVTKALRSISVPSYHSSRV